MSGPIVRSYGVPNWDEIFGSGEGTTAQKQGGKKKAGKGNEAKKSTKKKAAKATASAPAKASAKGAVKAAPAKKKKSKGK